MWFILSILMSIFQVWNADKFIFTITERYGEADWQG